MNARVGAVTGAVALVQTLVSGGVSRVFGLPGDTGVDLYEAMRDAGVSVEHVMCRDERHAAVMADVHARCTNEVGVVEVSSGGGATFCVGGLGEAFAASVPVLVISSDIHTASSGTGALTELDQELLFAAVTKWRVRVERASDIADVVSTALRIATTGRPAPVAVIVPENVLSEEVTAAPADGASNTVDAGHAVIPAERSTPDQAALASFADRLADAIRPAIVAGGGVHTSGAYKELAEFAENAGVPVATTVQGKGAFDESSPWSLGVVGANGARPYVNDYLAKADVVLLVGTRANATDTDSYRCPPRTAAVAQIDIDGDRAGRNYPGSIALVGDAAAALRGLTAEVKRTESSASRATGLLDWIQVQRRGWQQGVSRDAPDGTVHPIVVLELLREQFGELVTIVADCGTPTPFLASHWQVVKPRRALVIARGHGPMGFAIPGGVAAALAGKGRVVVLTTDGSLAMSAGELATISRLALPVTVVQLTNHSFGWIKMLQHLYYGRKYFGVDLPRTDAVSVARGFGLPGEHVDEAGQLRAALARAGQQRGPYYIDVAVPDAMTAPPPVAPWESALSGAQTTRPVY